MITVLSAIYGDYNKPKRVPDDVEGAAFLFTDSVQTAREAEKMGWIPEVVNDHWEPEPGQDLHGDPEIVLPMLKHKFWKCHPELAVPESDLVIWIDGSMEITIDGFVEKCVAALGEDDWACMRHPERTCIYPEAEYSAQLVWRYDGPAITSQAAFYRDFHPAGTGLIATGFSVRRLTPNVIKWGHHWWDEILRWSHQDQISLPVLRRLSESEIRWNTNLPWHEWWILHPHG